MPDANEAIVADYVIVGAGSAGAVLANRLSEDPDIHVVLIEAGGEASSLLVKLPIGFAKMIDNEKFDWRYEQETDPSINGRSWVWSAACSAGAARSTAKSIFAERATISIIGRRSEQRVGASTRSFLISFGPSTGTARRARPMARAGRCRSHRSATPIRCAIPFWKGVARSAYRPWTSIMAARISGHS